MKKFLFVIALFVNSFVEAQSDSSLILHQDEFLMLVYKHHPMVKKAELITRNGDLLLKGARGAFDPKLYSYYQEKQFDKKEYYHLFNGGLKVPTWYGVEGKVNFDNTGGYYLNPEANTPTSGLISAGVEVNVGNGLFIDYRRKALRQAKIYQELSEIEQFLELNMVMRDALKSYWDWVIAYNHLIVYDNALELASIRFEGVKKNFFQGAEPAIDTLEAYIQLQNRQFSYNEASLELIEMRLLLSNFLWTENLEPLEIQDNVEAPLIVDEFTNYISTTNEVALYNAFSIENHPVISIYDRKLKSLEVERKYKREQLKPKLTINYNFLTERTSPSATTGFSSENYKLGFGFKVPLFLRSERANYQLSKVKINQTELDQKQKARELQNKVDYYYSQILTLEKQEQIFTKNTVNYERLLDAEKRKFGIGESSLFLINSREVKVIASQIKLIDLRGKFQKSIVSLMFTAGEQLF